MKFSNSLFLFVSSAIAGLALTGLAYADTQTVALYQYVTEDRPVTILQRSEPADVESVDVNWRGATGHSSVHAEVLADGQLVWSGLIPAYDPTFHAAVRARVTTIELRVTGGSAYVNWAKVYSQDPISTRPSRPRGPAFVGQLTDAADLARELIRTLGQIEPGLALSDVQAHLFPLKRAAATAYAIAESSGGMRQIDVYNAVYALELEFLTQEAYFKTLIEVDSDFESVLNLMTIRERYRALFGSTDYPNS